MRHLVSLCGSFTLLATGCGGDKCPKGTYESGGVCIDDDAPVASGDDTEPGNEVSLDKYPPVVVGTFPAAGDIAVDETLDYMEVTFNKQMNPDGFSWVQISPFEYPVIQGSASWDTPFTNVIHGVVLEDDHRYRVWINDPFDVYLSFVDIDGRAAVPYPLAFHTGDGSDPSVIQFFEPAVVATSPEPGEDDVDPSLDRIEVTFSKDMEQDAFAWVKDASNTKLKVLDEGFVDARTAFAEVKLKPRTTYAVWINSDEEREFRDTDGNTAAPYLLTFRTDRE